ncbi:putative roadblock/LC7 domain containing protein [Lyophyllum shimeji]|uniref:Roadblock/LC7 domain containing protein n=1 Tax=Lyophyllum shimeji TaxID=47721 RepID=A0A9P3PPL1_LYOSH|nr:putative roadblock/LC7 domain containing protein [Lyophyllum shimeji]
MSIATKSTLAPSTSSMAAAPARTSFISQPNGHTSSNVPSSSSAMSPELESTLAMLSSHRSVLGYMLLSRGHPVSIIRHSGVIFEGEQGKKYATAIGRIVESVQGGLEEVHAGETDGDEVRFMRIRTKRHELMISPDDRYLLAVLHDPAT